MIKISSAILAALCFVTFGHAETTEAPVSGMVISKTKIADLEKLVAEGKGRKMGEGVYMLEDKFVLNGKEHPKTQYGGGNSSKNLEYFTLGDTLKPSQPGSLIKFFDKNGRLLWKKDFAREEYRPSTMVSNKGNVFFLYDSWNSVASLEIIAKSGGKIDVFNEDDSIHGVIVRNLYTDADTQFAKNSEMLFILAYIPEEQLALLGIDVTGEIKFFEKVKPLKRGVSDWYARVYFNPKQNQVLIDSNGIGENPPMLSYWSFPQKLIFNIKTVKDEVVLNASFADNNDILLLLFKKKDGSTTVRRLSSSGKEKYERSDVKKMDAQELMLSNEKELDVRSLAGCVAGGWCGKSYADFFK